MFFRKFVLMDAAGGDGGSAGGGAAAAGGEGGGGASASGGGSALAAGAGAGGEGAGAGAGAAGGASAAGAGGFDWLPEKYRVNGADGALDLTASAQKLAGGYGELSKRMVDGGAPPAAAAEYQVTIPEQFKDAVGDLNNDKLFTEFRADMHALGLSQKQFDGVMAKYFSVVPGLVAGGQQYSSESATADLRKTWGDDATFQKNVGLAFRASSAVAKAADMSFDDLEKAGLANNPTFIRIMAALGPEFAEDAPTNGSAGGFMSEDDVKKLMISEANTNPKHPDHKATRARIDAFYNRKYGNTPIV
ncbi:MULTISPECIES: hypothetical protein [Burkholderia]|uniref:hypothetical protein n=1 Tax=Burkholderia TaxID=32008 RepID=UPI000DACD6A3|nr:MULTISPECIES: hypothetical protein [Burkholderia]MDP9549696.1 hypothetical protein [Burkholderia cepacia]MBR8393356.1 hypothetical protein [Burkholderia cenocepacia]MBR8473275.1 hypothetical protein [Burkholderia cenocepacia]MBR8491768.1 hypothetical protein [Burkholderia cenocepacia]MDO5919693.1 hypothetical protein [Burkholderia cenocepacia]